MSLHVGESRSYPCGVRITARGNAADGTRIWSARSDAAPASVFAPGDIFHTALGNRMAATEELDRFVVTCEQDLEYSRRTGRSAMRVFLFDRARPLAGEGGSGVPNPRCVGGMLAEAAMAAADVLKAEAALAAPGGTAPLPGAVSGAPAGGGVAHDGHSVGSPAPVVLDPTSTPAGAPTYADGLAR